jgi:tetratricopeptide (TPR) repeat protein
MSDLESLKQQLVTFDKAHDLDGLRRVRESIVAEFPDSEDAAEALYKIGLDLLFRSRELDKAVDHFAQAAKRKHVFWSNAARTSLGLCYYHQRKNQKALFELRKVAYQEIPTSHTVTALAFIETIFENEGQLDEVKRVRKERITQLEKLVQEASSQPKQTGFYLYTLGVALRDDGNKARADETLKRAKAIGEATLGTDLYKSILDAL